MPIYERGKSFQVKLLDPDGYWITKTFRTKREAELYDARTKAQKLGGQPLLGSAQQPTLDSYFEQWYETVKYQASEGWRENQKQLYVDYVSPILGDKKVQKITPQMVSHVLNKMKEAGKAEQTQLHAYGLLRKMMRDAMEVFMLLPHSPVLRTMRPKVPTKEARHLTLEQLKTLLSYVVDKPYGLGIWFQAFLGLRVGELQALTWNNVDLEEGVVRIFRSYVRKEKKFREHPKGKKQHSHSIPPELLAMLKAAKVSSQSEYVVNAIEGGILSYEWYNRSLLRYCAVLKIPAIGTHGLRHSTSELYMAHGATADDLRRLFAHSSPRVTDRYLHDRGSRLKEISGSMKLFETEPTPPEEPVVIDNCGEKLSQSFPKSESAKVISIRRVRSS